MNNLTAAVLRSSFTHLDERIAKHRSVYFNIKQSLVSKNIQHIEDIPYAFKSYDSLQFRIVNKSDDQIKEFLKKVNGDGIPMIVFSQDKDNARLFSNWKYIKNSTEELEALNQTKQFVSNVTDLRLSYMLSKEEAIGLGEIIS